MGCMISFSQKINDDYALDVAVLYKYREFSDGISFFDLEVNWDRYLSDHKPSFSIRLSVLNFMLIDFEIYYRYHRDE